MILQILKILLGWVLVSVVAAWAWERYFAAARRLRLGEILLDEIPLDEIPLDEIPLDETSLNEIPEEAIDEVRNLPAYSSEPCEVAEPSLKTS